MFVMAEPDDSSVRARLVRAGLSLLSQRPSLLVMSVALVSAVGAFTAVRAWFAPVRAASIIPAKLTVDTQPAGAVVLIDGQARGRTPAMFSIDPGAHTLAVRAADVERTVQLTIPAGAQVAEHFDLAPNVAAVAPGRLSIVTDPPGLRVAVDGHARGVSPLVIDDLAAAEHTVTVASDAGVARRTITVANGVTKEVVFSLAQSTAPVAGWVAVASPFPVDVIEHNEVVGTSGAAKIMLAVGKHNVVLRNESVGYESRRSIDVVPGRVASLKVIPPDGLLNVNARPWADVFIDGAAAGQTPLANRRLPVGPHEITFRHPQLGERTEHVVITATGVNRVAVDLDK
jgi:hypothetical protein